MNNKIERRSPVSFNIAAEQIEWRDHWPVALRYPNEGAGPYLVDLSHRAKWDFQSADPARLSPWDLAIPERVGEYAFDRGMLFNRLSATQAVAWHLDGDMPGALKMHEATETTDGTVLLALVGGHVFSIAEKLTSLDFLKNGRQPLLLQGPVCHVPSVVVVFPGASEKENAMLISCSRGYAHDMVHAFLNAGREFGLRPAGEAAWSAWVRQ